MKSRSYGRSLQAEVLAKRQRTGALYIRLTRMILKNARARWRLMPLRRVSVIALIAIVVWWMLLTGR
jgi:hypothetical protein